jgi:hypothetical protein
MGFSGLPTLTLRREAGPVGSALSPSARGAVAASDVHAAGSRRSAGAPRRPTRTRLAPGGGAQVPRGPPPGPATVLAATERVCAHPTRDLEKAVSAEQAARVEASSRACIVEAGAVREGLDPRWQPLPATARAHQAVVPENSGDRAGSRPARFGPVYVNQAAKLARTQCRLLLAGRNDARSEARWIGVGLRSGECALVPVPDIHGLDQKF